MTTHYLDARSAQILRRLIMLDGSCPTVELAAQTGLTEKEVRSRLAAIGSFVAGTGARLERCRGVGLSIVGREENLARLRCQVASLPPPSHLETARDRRKAMKAWLLWASPGRLRAEALREELRISRSSFTGDTRWLRADLAGDDLALLRSAGAELGVLGPERRIRQVLVQEATVADHDSVRNRDCGHHPPLPVDEVSSLVEATGVSPLFSSRKGRQLFVSCAAIALHRFEGGRALTLDRGHFRSLVDHRAHGLLEGLRSEISDRLGTRLTGSEGAGLTEALLMCSPHVATDDDGPRRDEGIDLAVELSPTEPQPRPRVAIVCGDVSENLWVLLCRLEAEFPALGSPQLFLGRVPDAEQLRPFDLVLRVTTEAPHPGPSGSEVPVSLLLSQTEVEAIRCRLAELAEVGPERAR